MFNKHFKRPIIYILGVVTIAFSIALHNQHELGNGPIDQFHTVLADIFVDGNLGLMSIIAGLIVALIYFIKKRNKDIWISVIAILVLGTVISFFIGLLNPLYISDSHILVRLLVFVIAVNFTAIGVVMMISTKMSLLNLEMLVIILNELKPLRKLNFGQVRMITDFLFVLIAIILVVFTSVFYFTQWIATFALIFIGGTLINIYLKVYQSKFVKEDTKEESLE